MNRRDLLKFSGTLFAGTILTQGYAATSALKTISEIDTLEIDEKALLQLHFNENSLGLSANAKQAIIDTLPLVNRYPDASINELQQELAQKYNVQPTQVTLGVGSSDIIRAIINKLGTEAAQKRQNIQLISPDPSFFLAADHAAGIGINVVNVPLDANYCMDIAKMKQIADNFNGFSICYLCNPNNPTGTLTSSATIEKWVHDAEAKNTFFIIDEAYAEYITDPTFKSGTSFVEENRDNIIVLRTFSKIYAMAGLRLGYGIATEKLTKSLATYMTIINISLTTAVAGIASLKDQEFLAKSLAMNTQALAITTSALKQLDLDYLPSQGNFIFHKITGDPEEFMQRMKEAGILVGRPFPPLTTWCRITLGTPKEMLQYTNALKQFRANNWI